MEENTTDNLKMEILSTRPQCLTLEARHTISLEVSKQRRLKVANSLFLPRKFPNIGLSAVKQNEKVESIMNIRPSCPNENNTPNLNTITNVHTNEPGLGVISCFSIPTSSETPTSDQINRNLESKYSESVTIRDNVVLTTPFNWNEPIDDSEETLPAPSPKSNNIQVTSKSASQTIMQFPPNLKEPQVKYAIITNEIIEILSSDEEDDKEFVKTTPPTSRYTTNKPKQAMPYPMSRTPIRYEYIERRQPKEQLRIHQIVIPPVSYSPINYSYTHGYHPPPNYQPGFYTESYPRPSRQLAIVAPPHHNHNRMSPEVRYRPYEGQRVEVYSPHVQYIYERSSPPNQPHSDFPRNLPPIEISNRPSQSNRSHADFPRNLPPIDISNWMAPRYPRQSGVQEQSYYRPPPTPHPGQQHHMQQSHPVHQPNPEVVQPIYRPPPTPVNGQPAEQPSQELVPFGNPLQSFYNRMHEIYQAGLNRELPPPPPQAPYWLPDTAAAAAVDYAVALIRDAGNNWRHSQTPRRVDNNTVPVNLIMQQQTHPPSSPVAQADSTTGNNSPPSTINQTNTPRPVFVQNMHNPPPTPNIPNNPQPSNVKQTSSKRNTTKQSKSTLRSMLNAPAVPPNVPVPNMPNAADNHNGENPAKAKNGLNIINIHNLPNLHLFENGKSPNVGNNANNNAEETVRNEHLQNIQKLVNFQNFQNMQHLLHGPHMRNGNEPNFHNNEPNVHNTGPNVHNNEQNVHNNEQNVHNEPNANNIPNVSTEQNLRNNQNVPNIHNAPNLPNFSNFPNFPNFPNIQNIQQMLQAQQHMRNDEINHGSGPIMHNGQMMPNIPNGTIIRHGQRTQVIQNLRNVHNPQNFQPRPNMPHGLNFIPRFAPPPPPNIPNNRSNTRAQPMRPSSRVSSSAISPEISQMSLNQNCPQECPRNNSALPEYDPRDSR